MRYRPAVPRNRLLWLMERLPVPRLAAGPARPGWTDGEKGDSPVELPAAW